MDTTMSGCNGFSSAIQINYFESYFECRCLNIMSRNMWISQKSLPRPLLSAAIVNPTKDEVIRDGYKLLLIMVVIRHDGNIKFVCLGYGERYMYGVFKQSISKAGREGTKEDWLEVVWHIPSIAFQVLDSFKPDTKVLTTLNLRLGVCATMSYDGIESDLNEFIIYDDIGSWANVDDFQLVGADVPVVGQEIIQTWCDMRPDL
ncbi:alpha-glucan phosphorylase, H isozyme [Tanacetum coccineum]